jgi:hypothetical protein
LCPTASLGGVPLEKSKGLVVSITTFRIKFLGSAIFITLGVPSQAVERTINSSPNDAASTNVPADAFPSSPP